MGEEIRSTSLNVLATDSLVEHRSTPRPPRPALDPNGPLKDHLKRARDLEVVSSTGTILELYQLWRPAIVCTWRVSTRSTPLLLHFPANRDFGDTVSHRCNTTSAPSTSSMHDSQRNAIPVFAARRLSITLAMTVGCNWVWSRRHSVYFRLDSHHRQYRRSIGCALSPDRIRNRRRLPIQ